MSTFDVMSTDQNGIEVVIAPIFAGSLMLQFKGKAIYPDPDSGGDYSGLPAADFILLTQPGEPRVERLRKQSTAIVLPNSIPEGEKKKFGEIEFQCVGSGYLVSMAGRNFYISGLSLPALETPVPPRVDVAFVCAENASAAGALIAKWRPHVAYPYAASRESIAEVADALRAETQIQVRQRKWR